MRNLPVLKPVYWVGSSKRDLQALPEPVVDVFGYALYLAQIGRKHDQARPLHGFGSAGVLEIVEDHGGNTYRAIYTVGFTACIFVLHVFRKKSKRGAETPKPDMDLIGRRLKAAAQIGQGVRIVRVRKTTNRFPIEKGSGNIYADLGYADSNAMLIKAQLVAKIAEIIKSRNLTQAQAAAKLGLTQPKVSALLKGQFRGVSERRLLECLTRLGRDVKIIIRPVPKNRSDGHLTLQLS